MTSLTHDTEVTHFSELDAIRAIVMRLFPWLSETDDSGDCYDLACEIHAFLLEHDVPLKQGPIFPYAFMLTALEFAGYAAEYGYVVTLETGEILRIATEQERDLSEAMANMCRPWDGSYLDTATGHRVFVDGDKEMSVREAGSRK